MMKYLIVSDIHGSLPALEQVLAFYREQQCGMLCTLGDILNYGPRNGIPQGLDPKGIAERLNAMAGEIVAIRGNCDSEVDQMLLDFPILSDYTLLVDNGKRFFLTHGHIYNEDRLPKGRFDCLFYGHTHRWKLERTEHTAVCNTGSITFPKDGNMPTFAIYCDGTVSVHRLDGSRLKELSL
jgi:phosphodiesterase family protein